MKAKLLRWGLLLCCAGFLLFGLGLYFGRHDRRDGPVSAASRCIIRGS